jgi:addiction module HigA family antidote
MSRRKTKTIAAHPSAILRTEFMEPMDITACQLAKALHFPGIYEIVRNQRAVSADVALRLGRYFGMTPQFWMNLEADYDLARRVRLRLSSWFTMSAGLLMSIIVKDPEILGGEPVFRGTRVPFQALIDYLEGGETLDEFLDDFPTVSRENAIAALEEAKSLVIAQLQ